MIKLTLAATLIFAASAAAQDTRHVTEPHIPPSCTTLRAALTATHNKLRASDESRLDTMRIQQAIDHCSAGKAVHLQSSGAKNAFLSGALQLREGVALRIDKGVTLYASRDPKDFETEPGTCGISGANVKPCHALITIDHASNTAVIGPGTIDGRGGEQVIGKPYTWWQQSRAAEPGNLKYSAPRLIVARNADGLVLYNIRLHNSPNFHVTVNNTDGFTAWGVHLLTPTVRGTDARNTDGIDPGSSQNITITKSWIDNGDDNIAIKTGTHKMSVLGNHFYSGHGMSIGSETYSTDSDILVDALTLDHTTSGIRIKSNRQRGGLVENVTYRNICMRDTPVPISISPFYAGQTTDDVVDNGMQGDRIPSYKQIRLENVISVTPGIVQAAGIDQDHVTELELNGVFVRELQLSQTRGQFLNVTVGPRGTNVPFQGSTISTHGAVHGTAPFGVCEGKFVPYQD